MHPLLIVFTRSSRFTLYLGSCTEFTGETVVETRPPIAIYKIVLMDLTACKENERASKTWYPYWANDVWVKEANDEGWEGEPCQ